MFFIFVLTLTSHSFSQTQFTQSSDSDPKAKKILKEIKDTFDASETFSIDFHMTMSYPGEDDYHQEGTIVQQGASFHLDMNEYLIISNDATRWVYHKTDNIVNLYNAQSDDSWMTPKDFLNIYDSPEFVYTLLPDGHTQATSEHWIEFKSLDPDSDYSKVRMKVFKADNQIRSLKAFATDGSSYELLVDQINYSPSVRKELFQFQPNNYPGIKIEDLRID